MLAVKYDRSNLSNTAAVRNSEWSRAKFGKEVSDGMSDDDDGDDSEA